jgi:hypothetical protein
MGLGSFIGRRWQKHNDRLLRHELRTEQIANEEAHYAATNHVGPVDPDRETAVPIQTPSLSVSPWGRLRIWVSDTLPGAAADNHGEYAGVEYDESQRDSRPE